MRSWKFLRPASYQLRTTPDQLRPLPQSLKGHGFYPATTSGVGISRAIGTATITDSDAPGGDQIFSNGFEGP